MCVENKDCCSCHIETTINSDRAGRDGMSAYEIAVFTGKFTGTIEEFVDWNRGEQGEKGEQGEQGIAGGSLYNWFMFADDSAGTGISSNPLGKYYLGVAFNKMSQTPSTTPTDYIWYRTKGEAGTDGREIELRKTTTHIQWRYIGGDWLDLIPLSELKGEKGDTGGTAEVTALTARVNSLYSILEPILNGSLSHWYEGNPNFLPTGWVENEAMRGYFPLHRENTSQAVNTTGGSKTVQLVTGNLPEHTHALFSYNDVWNTPEITSNTQAVARKFRDADFSENYSMRAAPNGNIANIGKSGSVGSNTPHENMPPYKVGMWIKYVG